MLAACSWSAGTAFALLRTLEAGLRSRCRKQSPESARLRVSRTRRTRAADSHFRCRRLPPAWTKTCATLRHGKRGWSAQYPRRRAIAGVDRLVYTSTVGCIGVPDDGIGDENQACSLDQMAGDYKRSKFLGEQVAVEFARSGFPVVIVNPTAPMGDHDFKPTPTGRSLSTSCAARSPLSIRGSTLST